MLTALSTAAPGALAILIHAIHGSRVQIMRTRVYGVFCTSAKMHPRYGL